MSFPNPTNRHGRNRSYLPIEEMKQVDSPSELTARARQVDALRREIERLHSVASPPRHLRAPGNALSPQLRLDHQPNVASRLALQDALYLRDIQGASGWGPLSQQQHRAAALSDTNLNSRLLDRTTPPPLNPRLSVGDRIQSAGLLFPPPSQSELLQTAFLAGTAGHNNTNTRPLASSSRGVAFIAEGNQSIGQVPSGRTLEGRISSHSQNDILFLDARRRSSSAQFKDDEKAESKDQGDHEEDKDEAESDASDCEEDALDDEAFYHKRNSVSTVEDLHLQKETFPVTIYRMLYEVQKEGKTDVVSFLPHGRAFFIHKQDEFSKILPKYFSTDRMASFQRQLNLYGFRRITEGKDKGAFFHEKFIRGKRSLCKKIKRKRNKRKPSTSAQRRSRSESAPSVLQANLSSGRGSWGHSIATPGRGGSYESLLRLSEQRHMVLGSRSSLLNMSGAAQGLNLRPSSPSVLMQQQQLQQRLHEQEQINQIIMERQRRRGSRGGA